MLKAGGGMVGEVLIRSGLGSAKISDGAVYILGRRKELKNLTWDRVEGKFAGSFNAENWTEALGALDSNESVPLGFGKKAWLVGLAGKTSRCESPSEPGLLTRAVRSALSGGVTQASLVLYAPRSRCLASVAALARAFPLFSAKTSGKTEQKLVSIEILQPGDEEPLREEEISVLSAAAKAVREAAALVDMPCSLLNTDTFTTEAKSLAAELGVAIKVIRGEELKEGGFGGLYSVGKAAAFPPALVVLSHQPKGAEKTLALVGKGIVYDTGGMSLKTKMTMPGMKRDMGGAAAVLMGFAAAVKAGFKDNLHVLLCLAENHIGNTATKPDDIIRMYSGKTVEVNNTDAEGRLVLGDGVAYAQKVLGAQVIIDMATLTGAQGTATGSVHAALVSNSDEWETRALKAGRHSGNMTSPLPFAPHIHFEILSSAVADMKNSGLGKSEAASAVAALFIAAHLEGFPELSTEKLDWLHVDMAAPVHSGERATGYGPPLLLSILAPHLPHSLHPLLNAQE